MKKILVVIIFLFSLSLVNADNVSIGLDWLENNIVWDTASIEDISFTLLAFDANNINTGVGLIKLNENKDSSGCFPTGNCNTKDTALATLALYSLGEDIDDQLEWLNSTLTYASLLEGNWIIQIVTTSAGNCTFNYDNEESVFEIDGVENSWIYINDESKYPYINVEFDEPVEYIDVSCDLAGNTIVSLLRKVDNEFHIMQEISGNDVTIEINNACYPTLNGDCNVESSFYVSWVLNKINVDINTLPYLDDNADSNLYYAMLADIDDSEKNLDNLLENQNVYWDNVYTTSFAIDALENTGNDDNRTEALDWLKSQQISSGSNIGSWNGNILDTSVALYLALFEEGVYITPGIGGGYCGDGIKDPDEECDPGGTAGPPDDEACEGLCTYDCKCGEEEIGEECSTDDDCDLDEYCDVVSGTCKEKVYCSYNFDCESGQYCDTVEGICKLGCSSDADCDIGEECDLFDKMCKPIDMCGNGICESEYGEDDFTCPEDCEEEIESYCGDGICDYDEDAEDCPEDCKEKASLWWLWLIIIIIILVILGIFGFKYFGKPKKPKGPSFLGPQKPSPPTYQRPISKPGISRREEAIERELDKSLREARELLKKK